MELLKFSFFMLLYFLTAGRAPAGFECIGTYGETIVGCRQVSHYAFLDQGFTLRVLDIADPAQPKEIHWQRFNREIGSMAIHWPALYIGFEGGAIRILDITNPAKPVPRGGMDDTHLHMELEVMGDFLVAEGISGKAISYTVYDINEPFAPAACHEGGRVLAGGPEENAEFATNGKWLFYAKSGDEDDEGNRIIQIREYGSAAAPVKRKIPSGENFTLSIVDGKLVAGDSVSTKTTPIIDVKPSDRVWVYDDPGGSGILQEGTPAATPRVSVKMIDPENPDRGVQILEQKQSHEPVQRAVYGRHPGVENIRIAGNRGYIIDRDGGLQVLDLADPTRPRCLGRKDIAFGPSFWPRNPPISDYPEIRAVEGDLAYVTVNNSGFLIVDCSTPTSPTQIALYQGPSGPMSIQGRLAYVAAGENGLQILDLSNPRAIRLVGEYETDAPATDLVTSGSLVYLLTKELLVIDAMNPQRPRLIGEARFSFTGEERFQQDTASQLKKLGAAVYVIARTEGRVVCSMCRVVDVSNPRRPRMRPGGQINADYPEEEEAGGPDPVPGPPLAPRAKAAEWFLCLTSSHHQDHGGWDSTDTSALTVFSLSDPFAPRPCFRTTAVWDAGRAALYRGTLYIADGYRGLVVFRKSK